MFLLTLLVGDEDASVDDAPSVVAGVSTELCMATCLLHDVGDVVNVKAYPPWHSNCKLMHSMENIEDLIFSCVSLV